MWVCKALGVTIDWHLKESVRMEGLVIEFDRFRPFG